MESTGYDDVIGQNLAREWGTLPTPHDRVKRWYNEHKYYTYSKFASPMGDFCSREPCGHYTQVNQLRTGSFLKISFQDRRRDGGGVGEGLGG